MKKTLSFILCICIIFSCFLGLNVSANQLPVLHRSKIPAFTGGTNSLESVGSAITDKYSREDLLGIMDIFYKSITTDSSELITVLYDDYTSEEMLFFSTAVIYDYRIDINDCEELVPLVYGELTYYYPELLIDPMQDFSWVPFATKDGYLYSVSFEYRPDYFEKIKVYNNSVAEIVAKVDKNLSDLEKVVFVHDYICANYSYDSKGLSLATANDAIYDPYNFFVQKIGVCEAYALAFTGIMRALGFECTTAVSPYGDHMWNIIKLGGKYYHVDCTHDDPESARCGTIYHTYLLSSDAAIDGTKDHTQWEVVPFDAGIKCTDTCYDNYFWKDITTKLSKYNGSWYGIKNKWIVKTGSSFTSFENLYEIKDVWYADADNYYIDTSKPIAGTERYETALFSSCFVIGNMLYYNTQTSVKTYNIDTAKVSEIKINGTSYSNGIYGCEFDLNGNLIYELRANPSASKTYGVLNLGIGNLDKDSGNKIDGSDLVILKKLLVGAQRLANDNLDIADINYDCCINLLDLIKMKKIIAS